MSTYYQIVFKCDLCGEEFVDKSWKISQNLVFRWSMLPQGWSAVTDDSGERIYCPKHEILVQH